MANPSWKRVLTDNDNSNVANEEITLAQLQTALVTESGYAANKILKVNSGEDGISFATDSGGIALTDLSVSTTTATDSGSLSYANGSGIFTFAPSKNDDVSVANLETALASGFGGNAVTIGDANDTVTVLGDLVLSGGDTSSLTIKGAEGTGAGLELWADEGDDNVDKWQIATAVADNHIHFYSLAAGSWATKFKIQNDGDCSVTGDLTVAGNDIKNSEGTTTISMDTDEDITVAGDITVGGGLICSSGDTTAITLSSADVAIAGDLTVTGNDIKSSGGTTAITLSGSDAAVAGTLKVTGNVIQNSDGENTITMDANQNVTVAGNLTVSGTTTTINTATILLEDNIITLNSNASGNPTSSSDAGLEVERGDRTNVKMFFDESENEWVIQQKNHDTLDSDSGVQNHVIMSVREGSGGATEGNSNTEKIGNVFVNTSNNKMYMYF